MFDATIYNLPTVIASCTKADELHAMNDEGTNYTVWMNYHTNALLTLEQGKAPAVDDYVPIYDTEEGRYIE